MKKLLLGIFTALFLLSFFYANAQNQAGYSLEATASSSIVTITLNSPPLSSKKVQPIVSESSITIIPSVANNSSLLTINPTLEQQSTNPSGKTTWTAPLKGDTTYYVRIIEISGQTKKFLTSEITVKTGSVGEIFFNQPDFKKTSSSSYELSGLVDITKHKNTDLIPLSTITVSGGFYDKKNNGLVETLNPSIKLEEKDGGKYLFIINSSRLDNNTLYDLKLSFDSINGAHGEHTYEVDTGKGGIIPETGEARDSFFDKNSYRLLAPIPGMTALLDPALCQSEQYKNPGVICDINAFLNFLLSLAIGAAAVVLVVKIIISGYGYMTSDIPFVKARLKSGFVESLIGLVVALSAYLILNTINPRLVNNDVKVGVAEFEVNLAKDLGHENVVGAPVKLSGDVQGYGPFSVTGEGVIAGDYQSGGSSIRIVNKIYPQEMEKGNIGNVKTIVLHNTMGSTAASAWLTWVSPKNNSSCHFLIEKDGTIWQNARLTKSATCTGADSEWGITKSNHIGIEIVGCANNSKTNKKCVLSGNPEELTIDPPTQQQVQATIFLVNYLNDKFGTTLSNLVTTHGKVRERSGKKMLIEGQSIYDAIKGSITKK